jgi:hypothetical protein
VDRFILRAQRREEGESGEQKARAIKHDREFTLNEFSVNSRELGFNAVIARILS